MAQSRKALHEAASFRADRLDRAWFDRRPMAFLRLRNSLAFEGAAWDEKSHHVCPFMIIFKDPDTGDLEKRAFYAHRMPNQDVPTLAALWKMIQTSAPLTEEGGMVQPDPEQLAQMDADIAAFRTRMSAAAKGDHP